MQVIITGAGGDIGGACARLLAARGDSILIVDVNADSVERVATKINQGEPGSALACVADVSLANDVRTYVATAVEAWGSVDGVVHAAGVAGPAAPLPAFEEAEFDRVMAVNARGVFLGLEVRTAARACRGRRGERRERQWHRRVSPGRRLRCVKARRDRVDPDRGARRGGDGHPG